MKIEEIGGRAIRVLFDEVPLSILVAPNGKGKAIAHFENRLIPGALTILYGHLDNIKLAYFNVNSFEELKKLIQENPAKFLETLLLVLFSRLEKAEEK
ncbi:MAG: hypothetical protein JHC28_06515 [Thermoprotei archaeon]|nr:hypothetical protein [Thermoprotei archaeon]